MRTRTGPPEIMISNDASTPPRPLKVDSRHDHRRRSHGLLGLFLIGLAGVPSFTRRLAVKFPRKLLLSAFRKKIMRALVIETV